jgi:hypothetical protein
MRSADPEHDTAAALLERRWFASIAAVRAMHAECDVLREVMERTEEAWRRARSELSRLESLRDALAEALDGRETARQAQVREPRRRLISSAA